MSPIVASIVFSLALILILVTVLLVAKAKLLTIRQGEASD